MSLQTDWLETESEELTSSPVASRARTSPLPETGPACPVSAAASGPSFSELSWKFDPLGQSLRMSLGLELSGLTRSSLTWQEQATALGRWWWVLSMPELRTDDSEFGLLPTPRTSDGMTGPLRNPENIKDHKSRLEDVIAMGMLPTPTATDAQDRGYQYSQGNKDKPVLTLPGAVGAASSPQHGTGQGRLSPCFVEWMMGYPVGFTDVSD